MKLWLIAVGVVSLLGQVVLLRELLVASFGSELIYLLALGILLLVNAAGVLVAPRCKAPSAGQLRATFLTVAILLPLLVALARGLRIVFGGTPGAFLPLGQQLLSLTLVLLPFGVLCGMLFYAAAHLYVQTARTLARAYAVESSGGLVGGVVSTVVLTLGISNLATALLGSLVALAAAIVPGQGRRPRWLLAGATVVTALTIVGLILAGPLDRWLTGWNHPGLIATRDTPYGRVTLRGSRGQVVIFHNDVLAHETEGTASEAFVHLAALQVARLGRVLVLGGTVEGLSSEVLRYQPRHVDQVEVDLTPLALAAPFLPLRRQAVRDAANLTVSEGDPRRFLDHCVPYDLILIGMPDPDSGQTNRYYTDEFFARCHRCLTPDGVVALRLRGAENLWTPLLVQRTASIIRALERHFADVLVLPASSSVVLASSQTLVRDPAVLSQRWHARQLNTRLVRPAYLRYRYTNDRVQTVAARIANTRAVANSDTRPLAYAYTIALWLARFFPTLALQRNVNFSDADSATGWGWAGAAVGLVLLFLWARRTVRRRRALIVMLVGFVGMAVEGAVLLGYQSARGVLYQDIGLLLTMFMTGLCLGAYAIDWTVRRQAAGHWARGRGLILIAATVALTAGVSLVLREPACLSLPLAATILVAVGAAVGGLFAYATLHQAPDQTAVIAPLYALDLVGGAIGALAVSLLFAPLLGLPATVLVTSLLLALAALLV